MADPAVSFRANHDMPALIEQLANPAEVFDLRFFELFNFFFWTFELRDEATKSGWAN